MRLLQSLQPEGSGAMESDSAIVPELPKLVVDAATCVARYAHCTQVIQLRAPHCILPCRGLNATGSCSNNNCASLVGVLIGDVCNIW
jgi:hypothetical protein